MARQAPQRGRTDRAILFIRLRPADKRVLERRARQAHLTLSAWARARLLATEPGGGSNRHG